MRISSTDPGFPRQAPTCTDGPSHHGVKIPKPAIPGLPLPPGRCAAVHSGGVLASHLPTPAGALAGGPRAPRRASSEGCLPCLGLCCVWASGGVLEWKLVPHSTAQDWPSCHPRDGAGKGLRGGARPQVGSWQKQGQRLHARQGQAAGESEGSSGGSWFSEHPPPPRPIGPRSFNDPLKSYHQCSLRASLPGPGDTVMHKAGPENMQSRSSVAWVATDSDQESQSGGPGERPEEAGAPCQRHCGRRL